MRKFDVNSTKIGLIVYGSHRQHNKKLCPCENCYSWRRSTFSQPVLSQMQLAIRQTVFENLRLSREVDEILKG